MTNKECVEHLKKLKIGIGFLNTLVSDDADKDKIDLEALDFAIKALEERPTGSCEGCKFINTEICESCLRNYSDNYFKEAEND